MTTILTKWNLRRNKAKGIKFDIGRLVTTCSVADQMDRDIWFASFVYQSFEHYILCDWGDTCEEDKRSNDYAVKHGERILAEYRDAEHEDWRIWIITEWDRSVTTILFPDEY